jgi:protein-S-isoprenylcysteine O-methyltransferase Ste14
MLYALLVIAAWGTLFIPLPAWIRLLLSIGFIGLGIVLLLFGLAGSYWASHMTPGTSSATSTLVTAVLLLLSRMTVLIKTHGKTPINIDCI